MLWFKRRVKPSRQVESFCPPRIAFVGEQTGSVEDDLKVKFRQMFLATPAVQTAYLARVCYGDASDYSVALCINCNERLLALFPSGVALRA